jgi:phosphoglycerate dehydrogenase-like enzyme
MPKIVLVDDSPPLLRDTQALKDLRPWGEVEIFNQPLASGEELVRRIKGAEIVINLRAYSRFTSEVFAQCAPALKLVVVAGIGVDNVDLAAAKKHGVRVCNAPGFSTLAVAEHALALLLCVARKICELDGRLKQGSWGGGLVPQLHGKTLGTLGLGSIGGQLARLGNGIGMKVIAWSFHPDPERARKYQVEWVPFEEVFKRADVVAVNLRLSEQSRNLIGPKQFALMKPTAILLNTARGAIVDKKALVEALKAKKIFGAGLDVFPEEPVPADDPILRLPNVALTPHTAWMTPEAVEYLARITADNIVNFLQDTPTNLVI